MSGRPAADASMQLSTQGVNAPTGRHGRGRIPHLNNRIEMQVWHQAGATIDCFNFAKRTTGRRTFRSPGKIEAIMAQRSYISCGCEPPVTPWASFTSLLQPARATHVVVYSERSSIERRADTRAVDPLSMPTRSAEVVIRDVRVGVTQEGALSYLMLMTIGGCYANKAWHPFCTPSPRSPGRGRLSV
jgi:hypothetical protein